MYTISFWKEEEIAQALKRLTPKFSVGPNRDQYTSYTRLHFCPFISSNHFFLSFSGKRYAQIISNRPKHEKRNESQINNFHAKTNHQWFPKVQEMALFQSILKHDRNLKTEKQDEFIRPRSTVSNLFCITDFIANACKEYWSKTCVVISGVPRIHSQAVIFYIYISDICDNSGCEKRFFSSLIVYLLKRKRQNSENLVYITRNFC